MAVSHDLTAQSEEKLHHALVLFFAQADAEVEEVEDHCCRAYQEDPDSPGSPWVHCQSDDAGKTRSDVDGDDKLGSSSRVHEMIAIDRTKNCCWNVSEQKQMMMALDEEALEISVMRVGGQDLPGMSRKSVPWVDFAVTVAFASL